VAKGSASLALFRALERCGCPVFVVAQEDTVIRSAEEVKWRKDFEGKHAAVCSKVVDLEAALLLSQRACQALQEQLVRSCFPRTPLAQPQLGTGTDVGSC
jgi:hypothetical protein